MTDRSYQKVVRLPANERFRCADNVAALISFPPSLSLYSSLPPSAPFLYSSLPSLISGLVQPTLCFSVLGICLARSNPLLLLACTNTQMPAPSAPSLLPPFPACRIPAIPAPILIAIANRCQNASMQSAALRSCCLPFHSPFFLNSPPPAPPLLFTCCSCCSLCSLFLLLLLLPSCSCCSLTNCAASSLSEDKPQEEPVATWLP